MHSGAVATLVDLVGSVVIISTGSPTSGVSVDISISYMDAASADVSKHFVFNCRRTGCLLIVLPTDKRMKI